ncbi:Galanin receptor type 2 [Trichoplax sp. H2]|nr:Galanin receptor type 2 [Trichoplax sp. H2]|eukprot:RDD36548.1 Galanin receptor type 2 [Trichoplax sp. H2]
MFPLDNYIDNVSMVNQSNIDVIQDGNSSEIFKIFGISLISLFGIVSNIFISYTIIKKKLCNSSVYCIIFNMCISDMITLIALLISTIVDSEDFKEILSIIFREIVCKLSKFIITMSYTVSTLFLAILAVDRYFIIVNNRKGLPLLKGKRQINITITCVWIYSAIVGGPILHLMHIQRDNQSTCDVKHYSDSYNIPYFLSVIIINYLLPLTVMIITYSKIVFHLKISVVPKRDHSGNDTFQANRKRKISVIKMIAIATTLYMLTSFPFAAILLASALKRMSLSQLRKSFSPGIATLINIGFTLTAVSCVENPIIYLIFNSTLRSGLPKCCCKYCNGYQHRANAKVIHVNPLLSNFNTKVQSTHNTNSTIN